MVTLPRFLSRLKSQVSSRHFYEVVLHDELRWHAGLSRPLFKDGLELHGIVCDHSNASMYRLTFGSTESLAA